MTIVLKYWQLVRIDSGGKSRVKEIQEAKDFFQRQFPDLNTSKASTDLDIQNRLIKLVRQEQSKEGLLAQICLRCWISNQIHQVCIYLEHQFGRRYGFTCHDLFPLVLDDTLETTKHIPLSLKILETFEREKVSLATLINRMVKQNQEIKAFLLDKGIYLASDWAILNDTKGSQLQRILGNFLQLDLREIEQAVLLLEAYHSVYLQDRLAARRKKETVWKCAPPSIEQLEKIAKLLSKEESRTIDTNKILIQLQRLAQSLREYRVHIRGGSTGFNESFEELGTNLRFQQQLLRESETEEEREQNEFLKHYRKEFLKCLDRAITQTIQSRLRSFSPPKTTQFVQGLELLYCEGETMGQIALKIGLNGQSQVTRLLKLENFRADIQHTLLLELSNCILETVKNYLDPDQLLQQEQKIIVAMNEEITDLIKESADQTSTKKACRTYSLLAEKICQYLQQLRSHVHD